VIDSYDALVDLLDSIENFLKRLDIYTKIPPSHAMDEIVVKIMVELVSTLALATKELKQGRPSESVRSPPRRGTLLSATQRNSSKGFLEETRMPRQSSKGWIGSPRMRPGRLQRKFSRSSMVSYRI